MIVVIADDLSGAAELAGVAVDMGLTAEVQTRFSPLATSRVVCLDMEGRSLRADAAAAQAEAVYRAVVASRPEWVFLKFDSVLRGNIAAQIAATLEAGRLIRAVLITANPRRGRTIRNGTYFVEGVALDQTAFANDPVYPCATSSVRELLGTEDRRIITPDAGSTNDLKEWAGRVDDGTLAAGSADFFETLLRLRTFIPRPSLEVRGQGQPVTPLEAPVLVVCGSRAGWPIRVGEATDRGVSVFDIMDDPRLAADTLAREGRLLVGIGERGPTDSATPFALLDKLGDRIAEICARVVPSTLLLEGGATAEIVIRRMGWSRLLCRSGVGGGVGTLCPADRPEPVVHIKPGSYPWPEQVW